MGGVEPAYTFTKRCLEAGKSVCINTFIASILFKQRPEDVKLILIDPKVVNTYRTDIHFIRKGASEGVKELKELLRPYAQPQ